MNTTSSFVTAIVIIGLILFYFSHIQEKKDCIKMASAIYIQTGFENVDNTNQTQKEFDARNEAISEAYKERMLECK